MAGMRPDIDPDGLQEFSVVFTDRSLNHMSQAFQCVMRDLSDMLREVYHAHEVAIVSGTRFAIMHELRGAPEPAFEDVLARIAPCDVVLIEGYKREPVPKIEARRLEAKNRTPLAPDDPWIKAIAADHPVEDTGLPVFDLDDTQALADFAERICNLRRR